LVVAPASHPETARGGKITFFGRYAFSTQGY
jgi:hypothetical protein